ncbi:P-loop containing nucleoside triphosphate hydrolase protein [Polychytrium aggregatum]|uniref:P-loop containing nucleoside triphosphate hydrolase protein n=1 Tax=Polychytrium aggregatum TaxID=110093 RepID=UPI0022FE3550|nr:P-loop containing nucleoside triphosphate hydrolase protein [Polychytrium aggregatum]KAI9197240.1 P-loop containing nucleoside triphosphate hydrolase protein [Polychytrium aggregatum]
MCDFCRTGKLSDCGLCGKTTVIEPGTKPPAFRCHRCYLPWHLECMNTLELPPIGRYRHNHKWSCCFCQSIPANVKTILTYTEDWSNTSEALGDIYKRVAKVYSDHPFRLYLVKLENTAYRWALWVPDWWISRVCEPKLLAFLKAALQSPGLHPRPKSAVIMEEWTHVSRILQFKSRTQKYTHSAPRNIASIDEVLVSWKGLDIETSTWESWPTPEDAEYQEFVDSWKRELELENRLSVKSLPLPKAFRPPDEKTPEFLNNCTLKHYQIEGVGWLLYNHFHTVSSILADEMGLGKTLQIATFIGHLIKTYNRFPHLIVAPLSLIDHWIREFKRWTPWIEVVSYCGEKASKKMVYDHLMFLDKRRSRMRCHVIISTYEIMQNESQLFRFVPFETLICDEGHRIKNDSTKTYAAIQANIKAAHKVVMTGTPLQNNLKELHNLMCFLDPAKFANSSWRDNKIEDLSEESVKTLHDELVPYILRRTKAKYMSDLPPKIERFVPVSLTPLQRKIYKLALMKNVWLFNPDTKKGQPEQALRRTLADLRLLCIHPFIEEDNEIAYFKENYPELVKLDPMDSRRIAKMIEVSGKLELLSKMLRKLKQNGNKVLIFSQFKLALNILEDFLDFERYKFVRMDGETTQSDRVDVIGKFEDANSDVFVFLLTTRTGGLGLNLVAADTVIIFDPDWNPQLDKQAVARAHRIGQTRPVCIYRLFTQHSVEEKIMEIGKSKIILEHLIVQKMDESLDKNEVQDILKFGAQSIFSENSPKAIVYDDESVDKLLDRTVTEEQKAAAEAEELMSFEVAKVWTENGDEQAKKSEEELDQEIWKQIQIEIEHNKQQRLEQYAIDESGGRAKRASRMDINYRESQQRHRVEDVARLDPEFVPVDSSSSSDDTLPEDQDDDMIGVDKVQAKPDPRATKTTRPGLPLRTAQPAAAASAAPVRAPITQTGFTVMISPSPLVYFCCWLCGEPTYHPVESCPKALDYHHLQLCRGILTQQLQLNLGSIMELNAKIYLVDCWMKRLRPQPHVSMAPPSTPTVAALPGTAAVAAAIPEPGPSAAPPNKGGNASSVNQSHSSAGPASTPSQPPKPVPAQQSSTPNRAQKPTLLADREPLAAASNPTTAAPLPLSSNNNNTPSTPAAVANRPAAANQPPTRKSAATTPTSALPASLISLIGSLKKRESPSSVAKPVQPAQNAKAILDELFKGSAASEERNEPNIPPQGPAAPVVAQASSHQGAIAAGLVGIPVTTISPTARPAESAPIGTTNEAQVQKAMTENGSGRFEQLSPGLPTTAQPLRAPQGNVCELCGENGHRVIECVAAKKDPRRMEQVARERQAQGLISPAQMSVISKTIELFRGRRDALESSAAAAQNDIEMI